MIIHDRTRLIDGVTFKTNPPCAAGVYYKNMISPAAGGENLNSVVFEKEDRK